MENDDLMFVDENDKTASNDQFQNSQEMWKICIIDDDVEVHNITKFVMKDLVFYNKGLKFISAYSCEEAKKIFMENTDIALALVDVVMETDDAGLRLVKYLRGELKNNFVRIILRTGYPGQAPEEKIILHYDINDYKSKSELTAQKLFTAVITGLRSYNDLCIINKSKNGLEKIIEACSDIFELRSMKKFSQGILCQLTSILNLNENAFFCQSSAFAASKHESGFVILAATGEFERFTGNIIDSSFLPEIRDCFEKVIREKKSMFIDKFYIGYFKSKSGSDNIVFFENWKTFDDWEQKLIDIFCTNVSIAYDNIYLNKELEEIQKEIIITLSEATEQRSGETGHHVKRVAEYCKLLAIKSGLSEYDSELLWYAAVLHDIGKIGIPDNILLKPARLTEEEFEIIKNHTLIGYAILKNSNKKILQLAAVIALQHQEKFDGTGYPNGLKGSEIHKLARITCVADVFDALSSNRIYRQSWTEKKVMEFMKEQSGAHFDPDVIKIFMENIDGIREIQKIFS